MLAPLNFDGSFVLVLSRVLFCKLMLNTNKMSDKDSENIICPFHAEKSGNYKEVGETGAWSLSSCKPGKLHYLINIQIFSGNVSHSLQDLVLNS